MQEVHGHAEGNGEPAVDHVEANLRVSGAPQNLTVPGAVEPDEALGETDGQMVSGPQLVPGTSSGHAATVASGEAARVQVRGVRSAFILQCCSAG